MKKTKQFCIIFALSALFMILDVTGFSQLVLKGIIKAPTGEPASGSTITVKELNKSVISDNNGLFSITATPGNTLIITSLGFKTQQVIATNSYMNIVLDTAATSNLNDVVVIGYQSVRRKDLTGATGIVNMEDESKVTANSVGEAIQGLVPGVTVRNSGDPGGSPAIEIRGVANFNNSNPLYVIDGMLSDANLTITPDDIASIQILKDASAAAIYGSRAGNGVIIITTKHGKDGPAKFSFSAKYGEQQMPKTWNVMNASQYLQTVKTEYTNSGIGLPADIASQLANNTINTNWQNASFPTGHDQDYNLGVSGGTATSSYYIGGNYYKNDGDLIGNNFQRTSIRINTQAKRGILTFGENLLLSNNLGNNPGGGINAFSENAEMSPIIEIQGAQYQTPVNLAGWGFGTNDNPTYSTNYLAVNALDKINYNYAKIVGNGFVELKLTNWLTYRFNAGIEASFDYSKEVRDTGIWRYNNQPPLTSVDESRSIFTNFLLEHTLNFNKNFGKHAISAVVGYSWTQQKRDETDASRSLLYSTNGQIFTTIGSAQGTSSADGFTSLFWRSEGYLGRINYAYNDKYLLTLTGRIDQDSRFGPDHRTGYFPSAAAAWRISKENFFNVSWINDLKIRASYGKLGFSDNLGSFEYLAFLNNNPRAVYGTGQTPQVGQYDALLANPDLHWETRTQKNAGFDASLFNNRVSVNADIYNALSTDVLVQGLPVGLYLGTSGSPAINAASIVNKGIEIAVTYRSKNTPFHWDVSGNITTIKNKVLSVGDQGVDASGNKQDYLQTTDFIRAEVGHSIGEWYVIQTDGIFQSQAEIDNYKNKGGTVIQPDAKPGDIKYVDANGDGVINDADRQYEGSPWPTLQAGAQFNASYKNFSLNVQFVGVFGNKLYDGIRSVLDAYQNLTNFRTDINPWSPTNTSGTDPRLAVQQDSDPEVAINNYSQSSRWLESGSYVRLRNVELGYTIPANISGKAGLSNIRFYVSGQNLFTITKYKGLDPDVQGTDIISRGYDAGNWPPSRVLSVGFQCEF